MSCTWDFHALETVMHLRLSCTWDCHALEIVMHSRLSCTRDCHALEIVIHLRLSRTRDCHALEIVMHSILSFTQDCHALETVMHSRPSCTKDCLALETVIHSRLSCTWACHALETVMQFRLSCTWVKLSLSSSFHSIQAVIVFKLSSQSTNAWHCGHVTSKGGFWLVQKIYCKKNENAKGREKKNSQKTHFWGKFHQFFSYGRLDYGPNEQLWRENFQKNLAKKVMWWKFYFLSDLFLIG